ncbi:uncharacterized protein B0T23DRAFT_457198 [Neurospora hispaniola]|uniref:Ecp2 effector protein domain-containing protein n=1 Tax=Neurospora hispaniola TaxID=588809 RepID=A0AAJ0HZ31_9PEZI|nr:hypothetical protein B0T23DRAFT_457198 [Neurospora hispaniola]
MVAMKFATIAVLATVAVAAPTTAVTTAEEVKPWSWSQWVADLMNPDVVALTPEQAVEAYYASLNATASTHDGAASINKRYLSWCTTDEQDTPRHLLRPDVDAAVKCVSSLAALGTSVSYAVKPFYILCQEIIGVRMIVSLYGTAESVLYTTAHDFAVAGGHIMDSCTWGGTTGGYIIENNQKTLEYELTKLGAQ